MTERKSWADMTDEERAAEMTRRDEHMRTFWEASHREVHERSNSGSCFSCEQGERIKSIRDARPRLEPDSATSWKRL